MLLTSLMTILMLWIPHLRRRQRIFRDLESNKDKDNWSVSDINLVVRRHQMILLQSYFKLWVKKNTWQDTINWINNTIWVTHWLVNSDQITLKLTSTGFFSIIGSTCCCLCLMDGPRENVREIHHRPWGNKKQEAKGKSQEKNHQNEQHQNNMKNGNKMQHLHE